MGSIATDGAGLFETHVRSLAASWRAYAAADGEQARYVEAGTYFALRHRLDVLCNAVLLHADDAAIGELRRLFHGRPAWPVWTAAPDTAELLISHGFVPAEVTVAMARVLTEDVPSAPAARVDVVVDAIPSRVLVLNDIDPSLVDETSGFRAFITDDDTSGLLLFPHDDDVNVSLVMTTRAHRGRGLASAVIDAALAWARATGHATATLQATPDGQPLYERFGFHEVGRWQEWTTPTG